MALEAVLKSKHDWLKGKLVKPLDPIPPMARRAGEKPCDWMMLDPRGTQVCTLQKDHDGEHNWMPGSRVTPA